MAVEVEIGNFLHRIKRPIKLDANKKYKLVTIKMKHMGVVLRHEKLGAEIKSKMYEVKEGDFILSGIDARNGAFGIIPKELDGAIVTNDFWYFDIDEKIVDKRLFLELTSTQWFDEICRKGSDGTTQRIRLQKNKFFNQKIELPPIEEQEGFISRFKENKNNNDELKNELTHQQTLLKKLRQQILQEAIEGKLTKDWRADNPNIEPASELLKRIQAEKAQLIKDKKIKKQKPLPPISEDEKPFELPDGWIWCRLGEFAQITRGKSPKYSKSGVFKMINQKCVRWFYIDTNHTKSIDFKWFEFIDDSFKTMKNDVLVNSTGDGTIGRSAIVGNESIGYLFDSHVLRVKSYQDINQKLICLIINSDFGQDFIEGIKGATSTKQTELGVNNLSNFRFPLPPLPEQKAIVAKVEKLLALCDQLESQITRNQRHAEQLMQAVLMEAFSQQNEITDPSIRQAGPVAANV